MQKILNAPNNVSIGDLYLMSNWVFIIKVCILCQLVVFFICMQISKYEGYPPSVWNVAELKTNIIISIIFPIGIVFIIYWSLNIIGDIVSDKIEYIKSKLRIHSKWQYIIDNIWPKLTKKL